MFEWTEQQKMIRGMFRKFFEAEVVPNLRALDEEEILPYPILRKMFETFGIGQVALTQFNKSIEREKAGEERKRTGEGGEMAAMRALPTIELSRYAPGMVTALGISVGLTPGAIMSRGSIAQKEKFCPDLLTLKKIGSWAITEPAAGSDTFGSMQSTARMEGDEFVLNGQKTFITNGPHADTIVYYCKLDRGEPPDSGRIV